MPTQITLPPKFESLAKLAQNLPTPTIAVVYPDSEPAVCGAMLAASLGYARPIFVGNQRVIEKIIAGCADGCAKNYTSDSYQIIDCQTSAEAVACAVKMAKSGAAEALMKGSTHTDELMLEVVNAERGLRTKRRMSHCMLLDVPAYPKLLVLTDVALNIAPALREKIDIVQNAIDFAISLGIAVPKVALLSAVETLTERIPATLECAALCKMAEREQIRGGVVDGPLSFDLAISPTSVATKKLQSAVAGDADILVVSNLETGNILSKSLDYFAAATSLGLIVGAKVPIILTSRSTDARARAICCLLAKLHCQDKK